jgi:hypothetical protein
MNSAVSLNKTNTSIIVDLLYNANESASLKYTITIFCLCIYKFHVSPKSCYYPKNFNWLVLVGGCVFWNCINYTYYL